MMEVIGVKIDQINLSGAVEKITAWAGDSQQRLIVTVNPEIVVAAQQNQKYKKVLNQADLSTCDGVGLVWAARFLHKQALSRVTGVDLTEALLNQKNSDLKFFLLGAQDIVVSTVKNKFSQALIVGIDSGGRLQEQLDGRWLLENNEEIVQRIKDSRANILLVAFGGVKQELWLSQNLVKMPNIKVAIGVGGTFDYLAGKISRAPKWLRLIGLEWLFRLIKEPKRIRRIYNAIVKFGYLVIKQKMKSYV
jgi:N-acetylglucosaminyldiphosphoundecaprenol N-acetyl-beta-D-mannosaminyltransferase